MNNVSSVVSFFYTAFMAQLFRFGIVGLIAAGVHFSGVVLLVQLVSLPPLVANVFAFGVSFHVSYWGHRLWTFQGTESLHRQALPKLLTVQLLGFTANESLFYLFLSMHIPYPIALLFVLSIVPFFTFFSSKLWVFR